MGWLAPFHRLVLTGPQEAEMPEAGPEESEETRRYEGAEQQCDGAEGVGQMCRRMLLKLAD